MMATWTGSIKIVGLSTPRALLRRLREALPAKVRAWPGSVQTLVLIVRNVVDHCRLCKSLEADPECLRQASNAFTPAAHGFYFLSSLADGYHCNTFSESCLHDSLRDSQETLRRPRLLRGIRS